MRQIAPWQTRVARRLTVADAVLAAIVMGVVALMVVPLPTWLLDLLLASNLTTSVAILLVTLHVSGALGIATFPSLLLITTLVRLALNVSSTRLILLQADAGEVIRAFGSFVVQGNYVVGAIIFFILSIIQFIVIARGSERIAEVGARFALDAMPGKQMSIDADVRAGAIDATEAGRRRRELERTSQFYGAMDGAMKFVKGDVIASFVIIFVNIIGGLAIGIGQHGMAWNDALRRYGLLTIGDGLVTQIPSLLLATAAGMLVTRVESEKPEAALGEQLSSQLFASPRALYTSSFFVIALAILPGLPTVPFLVIGLGLLVLSRWRERARASEDRHFRDAFDVAEPTAGFVPAVVPWSVSAGSELKEPNGSLSWLDKTASAGRERIFRELGVPVPRCAALRDETLPARTIVVAIHEVPAMTFDVPQDVTAEERSAFVEERIVDTLRARAADFIGIAETQSLLDRLEQLAPATVRQLVPKPIDVPLLAEVLRRLLEERVSIRDLKGILEAMAPHAAAEKNALDLSERVRASFRRAMTYELTRGAGEITAYLLEPMIEDTIRGAVQKTSAGSFLTLAPGAARDIVGSLRDLVTADRADHDGVVLTQPDIRRFVRKLIETELPDVRVVSYAELLPEIAVKVRGKASVVGR